MLKIKISNRITISSPPPELVKAVKAALTIPNPLYYKLMRATGNRARAFYGCKKEFKYYRQDGDLLLLPRGFKSRLIKWLNAAKYPYEIEEDFIDISIKT